MSWKFYNSNGSLIKSDITPPLTSTDNAIARWGGTQGDILQNSDPTIDDNGNVNMQGNSIDNLLSLNTKRYVDQYSGADLGVKLQNAIDDLPSTGGLIYLPGGDFTVPAGSEISTTQTDLAIIGDGKKATEIKYTGGGTFLRIDYTGAGGLPSYPFALSNFRIYADSKTAGSKGIYISQGKSGAMKDVEIWRMETGLQMDQNSHHNQFFNLTFYDCSTGLNINSPTNENVFYGGGCFLCDTPIDDVGTNTYINIDLEQNNGNAIFSGSPHILHPRMEVNNRAQNTPKINYCDLLLDGAGQAVIDSPHIHEPYNAINTTGYGIKIINSSNVEIRNPRGAPECALILVGTGNQDIRIKNPSCDRISVIDVEGNALISGYSGETYSAYNGNFSTGYGTVENLLSYSQDFTEWTYGGVTTDVVTGESPPAGTKCTKLTGDGSGAKAILSNDLTGDHNGKTFLFSVWLKTNGNVQPEIGVRYQDSGASNVYNYRAINEITTTWTRVATCIEITETTQGLQAMIRVNITNEDVFAWGAQLEEVTSLTSIPGPLVDVWGSSKTATGLITAGQTEQSAGWDDGVLDLAGDEETDNSGIISTGSPTGSTTKYIKVEVNGSAYWVKADTWS